MRVSVALALVVAAMVGMAHAAEEKGKIKVLVVTGGHGFNRKAFFQIFKENAEIAFTEAKQGKSSEAYDRDDLLGVDVLVLYDMVQKITDAQKAKFLSLLEKGVGLVVLHHALASYQSWPEHEKTVGGKFLLRPETRDGATTPKSGTGGGPLDIHVVSKEHAITAGMDDFTFQDEYYIRCRVSDKVTLLLTTDNPKNQRQVAWCREHGKSRIVYLMSGHDQRVYNHPSYRRFVANAIRWAAKR